jgi:hypothetical protein
LLFWRVSLKEDSHTITLYIQVLDALKVGYPVVLLRLRDYPKRLVLSQSERSHQNSTRPKLIRTRPKSIRTQSPKFDTS